MTAASPQVLRFLDADDLATHAARRLVDVVVDHQQDGRVAILCLTGGRIALRVYSRLADLVAALSIKVCRKGSSFSNLKS